MNLAAPELPAGAAATREQREAARAAIYRELGRHRLAQVVALRVADAINNASGWTFISQNGLADALGLDKRSVQRALRSLTGRTDGTDPHAPILARPYLYRVVSKTKGGRPISFHALVAVDADRAGMVDTYRAGVMDAKPTHDGRGPGGHGGHIPGGHDARPELSNSVTFREPSELSSSTDSGSLPDGRSPSSSDEPPSTTIDEQGRIVIHMSGGVSGRPS